MRAYKSCASGRCGWRSSPVSATRWAVSSWPLWRAAAPQGPARHRPPRRADGARAPSASSGRARLVRAHPRRQARLRARVRRMGHGAPHRPRSRGGAEGARIPLLQGGRRAAGGGASRGGAARRSGRSRRRPGPRHGPGRGRRRGRYRRGVGADRSSGAADGGSAGLRGARRGAGGTPVARCLRAGARRRAQRPRGPGRDRRRRRLSRGRLTGGGAHGQVARAGQVDRTRRGGKARPRASRAAVERRAAPRGARPGGADGTAGDHRAARRAGGAPLAGGARVTAPAAAYGKALDLITRVRGVRGAMLVSAEDGIVVAEQLMEGIKGPALSALAASLATRLRRAMEAAGVGASLFWHLQAEQGALLVVPTPGGTLVVAVAEPDVNVGLVRLELLRAAELVG